MTTRATITASTLREIGHAEEIVTVGLRGGDAQYAVDAVCVDLDRGLTTHGEEWAALVRRDKIERLCLLTKATVVGPVEPWDGSRFGDGNGGTVERQEDGSIVGSGLYPPALA